MGIVRNFCGQIAGGIGSVAGATGTNYIQQWTGWNNDTYNGLYIGLNIASSIGSIVGNISMKFASTAKLNAIIKNPEL